MEQIFKRGNLVRLLTGHKILYKGEVIDISPQNVGRTAVIQYSYNERFGKGNLNDYSIMFTDTGETLAWKKATDLELVDEGGEHLFAECLNKNK